MGKALAPGVLGRAACPGQLQDGTLAIIESPAPRVELGINIAAGERFSEDELLLAAIAYGEASEWNVFEEMAAIANVLSRQKTSRGHASLGQFMERNKSFAYAATDGNPRFVKFRKATPEARLRDDGMRAALIAARNAMSGHPVDYSAGAFFWDGRDIASNPNHEKRKKGLKFSSPSHDIFCIGDQLRDPPVVRYWINNGKPTRVRGSYQWVYESTAAWGESIFWRLNPAFIEAEGSTEHGS